MNYDESTHRHRWQFSATQLADTRKSLRVNSIATISKVKAESDAHLPADQRPDTKLKPIRLEEEARLCKYYQTKMQQICKALNFPAKVSASAVLFFKRFYLSFSSLDHDPKNVMLTCIYLACKIEEAYIGADQFCSLVNQDSQSVLRNELNVLHGLKFDLITHPPLRALDGFFKDLDDWRGDRAQAGTALQKLDAAGISKAQGAAHAAVDALMLTDAPLLYSPSLLALAALRAGFRKVEISLGQYLSHITSAMQDSVETGAAAEKQNSLNTLMSQLADLDQMGQEGAQPVDDAEVRKIDRKLKACHNPLLDPDSEVFKKHAAAAEQLEQETRDRKWQQKQIASKAAEAELLGTAAAALSQSTAEKSTKRKREDNDA